MASELDKYFRLENSTSCLLFCRQRLFKSPFKGKIVKDSKHKKIWMRFNSFMNELILWIKYVHEWKIYQWNRSEFVVEFKRRPKNSKRQWTYADRNGVGFCWMINSVQRWIKEKLSKTKLEKRRAIRYQG